MDFDKEYAKFVQHITDPKKGGVMGPVKFSKEEDMFAKLFVAYLNCRYASAHLTSAMNSDGESDAVFEDNEYAIDYVDSETIRLTRRR